MSGARTNSPVLCSTGAIITRQNGRDYHLIESIWPGLHCDGLEFMMYDSWYAERAELERFLAASGIPFPTMHVDKDVGNRISRDAPGDTEWAIDAFATNCEIACAIGARLLVLHLWGNADSDRHIAHNFDLLARLLPIARAHGLTLTVENVVCAAFDPMSHIADICRRFTGAAFTIDTKMCAFHDQLALLGDSGWRWLWDGPIRHLHINDYGGGYRDFSSLRTLQLGDGRVDFDRFFRIAARGGYRGGLTCECTSVRPDGTVDLTALNRSLDMARALRDRYLTPQSE